MKTIKNNMDKNMDKKLLLEIKEYIEKMEVLKMWEYSSHIVDDDILFADKERMPKLYFMIKKLIT